MNRREVLNGCATLAAGALLPSLAIGAAKPNGLAAHAKKARRSFGCAVHAPKLMNDARLQAAVAREADLIVPETELKWKPTEPQRGQTNYGPAEQLLGFAETHGLRLRGHTALWHRSIPDWAMAEFAEGRGAEVTLARVRDVVGHFRGRIFEWDVINEAIEPPDGLPHGLRNSPFTMAGGKDLFADCFFAAHEADPSAKLYYNDYGIEYSSPDEEARRGAVLDLLSFLKGKGAPVHGLGIQGHLTVGNRFRPKVFASFLSEVAALGIEIRITELDVSDRRLPPDFAVRDEAVADKAVEFVEAAFAEPAVIGVVTWGLADPSSWLDTDRPRPDKAMQRALPLDEALARKPFWDRLASCYDAAPKRA